MSTLATKIVVTATRAFRARGIRGVKMDDLARELGISKRTLYETFCDKETLLDACCQRISDLHQKFLDKTIKQTDNALEIILQDMAFCLRETQGISIEFVHDVQSYKHVAETMKERRKNNTQKALSILQRGVEQGLFRPEVDYALFYEFFARQVGYFSQDPCFRELSLSDIYNNIIILALRGCCTEKGLKQIDNFKDSL